MALTPQQLLFKEAYLNPNSPTFGNALRSAKKAKYGKEYCRNITGQGSDWISEIIRDKERLGKAEKVLDDILTMDTTNTIINGDDLVEIKDTQILKIKQDTAKFVAKGMARDKYSDRGELEDSRPVQLVNIEKMLIQIANTKNGEPKPIQQGTVIELQEAGNDLVQGREGQSDNLNPQSTDSIRADIHKALSQN